KPTLPLQVHAALINTVDPDYRVLFMLMSVAGLRIGVASLGYDLTKDSIGVQNALGHADEIITKNIYIHISQEQASSVIEAVANRILGENSDLLAQESQSVN
ncbi:MAG TPA: hypothetical protein VFQ92_19875, partial [Blastocatellia bacterium]|nr:hypothetical protein [Blastocatellia bacterium]